MSESTPTERRKPENLLLSLLLNIVLPALLLIKGGEWFGLPAWMILVMGLSFPLGYGIWFRWQRKKINLFSSLGILSVLLTGGIGLLSLPPEWIAIKEAAIPLAFGVAVLITAKAKKPLVKLFLFNDEIFQTEKLEAALREREKTHDFDRLLYRSTLWVSASFLLSAVLNFFLAKAIVRSPGGTEAFNAEIGQLAVWSFPVIVLPCTIVLMIALFQLFKGIQTMTGMELESFMRTPPPKEKAPATDSAGS